MTRREWLRQATGLLTEAGCEDGAFDARCLLEDFGGLGRGRLADDIPLTPAQEARLSRALAQRADGRPLQYILGEWEFLSLTLSVGEGVLIPRPDTEVLCETAAEKMKALTSPKILDLCAGSGCVGLGVASLCPEAQVTLVELSEQALPYLKRNVSRYPQWHTRVVQADVLTQADRFPEGYAAIVSNPPYVPTGELPLLQREVQREPVMALDGAADGLRFYRAIARHWVPKLAPGGLCAVEVGYAQAKAVAALFSAAGLEEVTAVPDAAGILRVVYGTAPKK